MILSFSLLKRSLCTEDMSIFGVRFTQKTQDNPRCGLYRCISDAFKVLNAPIGHLKKWSSEVMPRALDQWMTSWGYLPKHLQIQGSLVLSTQTMKQCTTIREILEDDHTFAVFDDPWDTGVFIVLATQTQGNSRDKSGQLVQCYHRFCDPGLLSSYETQVGRKSGIFSQNQPIATKFRRLHL